MPTLLDNKGEVRERRPRHPEKQERPDTPMLRKPPWIRVKAPTSEGYLETREIVREAQLHDRLRGGRLPEHRRVLDQEARHVDDHGRHLHARLRVLQCRAPACLARSMRMSRESVGEAVAKMGLEPCRDHVGRPR